MSSKGGAHERRGTANVFVMVEPSARLQFHPAPKHGSWLNQAEVEISVFERSCLSRSVGDLATLERRVGVLEEERNARRATINWQFTPRQARVTLKILYPLVKTRLD